ncbi:hypothetical protein H0H92_009063 [Tricholoma furcatifolium]|nr:hypothetical protein H0H92_009063 [Tricholoma furcatifolium]
MGSRTRRDSLSNVESLILAQAVWEHGANAWPSVSKILSAHPLISRPKSFFTVQSSQIMYQNLLQESGLERNETCDAVHSPINYKLAEGYYRARVQELRELILAEEAKFRTIASEINAIRSGNLDAEITAKLTGVPVQEPVPGSNNNAQKERSEDLFSGSDLSGVSVTPTSPSQSQSSASSPIFAKETAPQSKNSPPPPPPSLPVEGSIHAPISIDDDAPSVTSNRDIEEEPVDKTSFPTDIATPSAAFQPARSPEQEEEESANIDKARQEEEEDEDEVMEEMAAITPGAAVNAEEVGKEGTPQISNAPAPSQEHTQEMPESLSESNMIAETEAGHVADDGESSGEEPLHASRRSARRRGSIMSAAPPLQTRGKRRQRADSVVNAKDESEIELIDDDEDAMKVELDRDASPVAGSSRRGQDTGKRKASFVEGADSPRDKKRTRDDSEPVEEDEAGASAGRGRRKKFQAVIGMLHSQISQHRNGNIFHNPIKNSEAPDYHEIVKRPMDLKTIKMRVKDGTIGNSSEYHRDIMLMFANAMMYNRPGSDVYAMAEDVSVSPLDTQSPVLLIAI